MAEEKQPPWHKCQQPVKTAQKKREKQSTSTKPTQKMNESAKQKQKQKQRNHEIATRGVTK